MYLANGKFKHFEYKDLVDIIFLRAVYARSKPETSLRLTEIDKDCRVPERIFAPDFGKSHVIEFKKGNGTS